MSRLPLPLAGNPAIHHQLAAGRLSHAYILSGPTGSGRHTLAGWLCQAYECSAPQGNRPCGVCSGCKKAAKGIHPDIITIHPKKSDGKNLKPAEFRDILANAYILPNDGKRKIYLLPEAAQFSETVQNVLLKTIEDGPEYVDFLMIVENSAQLIGTVRSRCEELKLAPVSPEEALPVLAQRYPDRSEEELRHAILRSDGIIGRAIQLLEEQTQDDKGMELAEGLCAALAQGVLTLAEFTCQYENDKKKDRSDALAMCRQARRIVHSALLLREGRSAQVEARSAAMLARMPAKQLLRLDALLTEAISRLESNCHVALLLAWITVTWEDFLSQGN